MRGSVSALDRYHVAFGQGSKGASVRILAFDTSLSACSAAVWQDGVVLASRFEGMERGQSEALLPMIKSVMDEAGMAFAALDLIGTTVGPGAFTGLRIGLSAARAIGLGAGVPVAGVSSLEALASGVSIEERAGRTVMALIDSKRDDLFVQCFDAALAAVTDIEIRPLDTVFDATGDALIAVGNGLSRLKGLPSHVRAAQASPFPDAGLVAGLVAVRYGEGKTLPPTPLYLRAADTTCAPSPRPAIL